MYVYWWHVGGLRAVKVGHADDPRQRVSNYRDEYGLSGRDVRGYELDSGTDAEWVESQLCRTLETRGFRRIALRSENGEGEFFSLDGRTFEEAHELLRDTARHIAFAEISNQRKRRRRHALEAAPVPTPHEQEPATDQADEEPRETDRVREERRPDEHHTSAHFQFPVVARLWLYLIGAVVVWGLVTGLTGYDLTPGPSLASLTEQKNPTIATASQDGGSSAGPLRNNSCTLVELSDTLVRVRCAGSWASMRWNGRWAFDSGHDEGDAVAFFHASDVARRVVAFPSREPVPQLPERAEAKPERLPRSDRPVAPAAPPPQPAALQADPLPAMARPQPPQQALLPRLPERVEVKPERSPQSDRPVAPAAPPPQPAARQADPLPAMARPQPQPPQEVLPPRQKCTVSRPKPGFQVYLVTCPNSQAMIGRTVDVATGWTVSESVNGTEAIEFFMRSPYAR